MLDIVNMPTVPHCARGVVATRVLTQDKRWAEIFVGRTEHAYFKALCVVGFNQFREPVTTSALLLPKEETVYVEAWAEVHHVRVTDESYSTRENARIALHSLDALYALPPCERSARTCDCERNLDAKWRWAEACEAQVAAARFL